MWDGNWDTVEEQIHGDRRLEEGFGCLMFGKTLMQMSILACFTAIGVAVGTALPVERTVNIQRVIHRIPPPVKVVFKDRVIYKDRTEYVPVKSQDEYLGPAGSCERGNPVVIQQMVIQDADKPNRQTWLRVVPVGQKNNSICRLDGDYSSMFKEGMVISINTGEGK